MAKKLKVGTPSAPATPSPSPVRDETYWVEYAKKMVEYEINGADGALENFTRRFEKDPAYAFERSSDAFKGAALKRVWERVNLMLFAEIAYDDPLTAPSFADRVAVVDKELMRDMMRRARSTSRSTIVPSNLLDDELRAATAEALAKVSSLLARMTGTEPKFERW